MKNRMLGVIVPILAGAALIGTGFSTWYFTTDGAAAVDGIATSIAKAYEIGSVTLKANGNKAIVLPYEGAEPSGDPDTFALRMDASSDSDENIDLMMNGTTSVESIQLDYQISNLGGDFVTETQEFANKTATLKITVSLGEAVSTYVKLSDSWTKSDSNFTFTRKLDNLTVGTNSINDLPPFGFAWVEGEEPDNASNWKTMWSKLDSASISINYSISFNK